MQGTHQFSADAIGAVIADLAGTTVDFGSRAPAGVFVEVFRRAGVEISLAEARVPMGMGKRDHIRELLRPAPVGKAWHDQHNRDWDERDVDALYEAFIPLQLECLANYNGLIPGVLDAVNAIQAAGVRFGVNTGYTREMTDIVIEGMKSQGVVPEGSSCFSDVRAGRPAPWMIFHTMEQLDVFPPAAVIVVGDTFSDIKAGRNAGVWTVGVSVTGNMLGMSAEELARIEPKQLEVLKAEAERQLLEGGAHYVLDSFAELPALMTTINQRLSLGERP